MGETKDTRMGGNSVGTGIVKTRHSIKLNPKLGHFYESGMTLPKYNPMDPKTQQMSGDSNSDRRSISSELPPYEFQAFQRTASESLKMAKVISKTLLAITAILSALVLISVYIQANNRCSCAKGLRNGPMFEPLTAESQDKERRLPLSIRMAGSAGDLMNKINTKGHVNCVVERKVANQIIASEPKTLITPYGNITTDPRLIHLTGEKMVFTCDSANKEHNKKNKNKTETEDKQISGIEILRSKRSAEKKECACDCRC